MRHLHGVLVAAILFGCGGDDEPTIDGAPPIDAAPPVDAPSPADVIVVPPNDTDLDGLSNAQEDPDGDGVVDPGESDPTVADSDGDGVIDLKEWAAGSDRLDPASVPPSDLLLLVVPHSAGNVTADVSFQADIHALDVVLLLDSTAGSGEVSAVEGLKDSLETVVVPNVSLVIPDVTFAVAEFKDFPVWPFGSDGLMPPMPYLLQHRISTDIPAVHAALELLSAWGGADGPHSGLEALYQAVTGEGIMWTVGAAGEVEKFEPLLNYDPAAGHGLLGGVGFRDGAYPMVVYLSGWQWHDASEYWAAGIPEAHTRDEAVDAAYASGIRILAGTSNPSAMPDLVDMSFDTRSVVPMSAAPSAPASNCMGGMCAVPIAVDGTSTSVLPITEGLETLLTYAPLDVFLRASGPIVDGVHPVLFIESLAPASPAPPGTVVDGDTLRLVPPGTTVPFTVTLRDNVVLTGPDARVWSMTIDARAEAWIDLGDDVTLLVIVPAQP